MFTFYLVVAVCVAGMNLYAATNDFKRPEWMLAMMARMKVPEHWLLTLGILKFAGAVGILVGIRVPLIGVASAAGLVLYFIGAIATAFRARYYAHLPYPTVWLILAGGALALRLVTL